MEKISSNSIMNLIFQYIEEEKFKYKLVSYSKYLQKRLKLTLLDYQEYYFSYIQKIIYI